MIPQNFNPYTFLFLTFLLYPHLPLNPSSRSLFFPRILYSTFLIPATSWPSQAPKSCCLDQAEEGSCN
ncbi:unnamed protein product [Moneuplotes crassus]|uniref:Uncharacterized protein n=1 Tax=Euplotes crassus TaxID=5936 RepID=A0AAD2D299_EUPCR|nr:unnamed protein product [Moneuplotes crassus]